MSTLKLGKLKYILAAIGGLAITFQRNPDGATYVIILALVGVLGLAVWRIPPLLAA